MSKTTLPALGLIIALAVIVGVYFLFFANRSPQLPRGTSYSEALPPKQPPPSLIELGDGEYDLLAVDFMFDPEELVVPVGKPVKIFVDNIGEHTFTIDELGVDVPLKERFETIEFTPDKAGTFEFYSKLPGHKEAGMFGTLKVTE